MDPDASWAKEEFGEADLGDVRRNARLIQLASVLGAQPNASLPDAELKSIENWIFLAGASGT